MAKRRRFLLLLLGMVACGSSPVIVNGHRDFKAELTGPNPLTFQNKSSVPIEIEIRTRSGMLDDKTAARKPPVPKNWGPDIQPGQSATYNVKSKKYDVSARSTAAGDTQWFGSIVDVDVSGPTTLTVVEHSGAGETPIHGTTIAMKPSSRSAMQREEEQRQRDRASAPPPTDDRCIPFDAECDTTHVSGPKLSCCAPYRCKMRKGLSAPRCLD